MGSWGYKPQRPPIVGHINVQKCLAEIGGSGYKWMAKIAISSDNNSYITPPPGPPVRGQYSIGLSLRIRGIYLSGSPLGPVQARLFLVPDPVINHCKWPAPRSTESSNCVRLLGPSRSIKIISRSKIHHAIRFFATSYQRLYGTPRMQPYPKNSKILLRIRMRTQNQPYHK